MAVAIPGFKGVNRVPGKGRSKLIFPLWSFSKRVFGTYILGKELRECLYWQYILPENGEWESVRHKLPNLVSVPPRVWGKHTESLLAQKKRWQQDFVFQATGPDLAAIGLRHACLKVGVQWEKVPSTSTRKNKQQTPTLASSEQDILTDRVYIGIGIHTWMLVPPVLCVLANITLCWGLQILEELIDSSALNNCFSGLSPFVSFVLIYVWLLHCLPYIKLTWVWIKHFGPTITHNRKDVRTIKDRKIVTPCIPEFMMMNQLKIYCSIK